MFLGLPGEVEEVDMSGVQEGLGNVTDVLHKIHLKYTHIYISHKLF